MIATFFSRDKYSFFYIVCDGFGKNTIDKFVLGWSFGKTILTYLKLLSNVIILIIKKIIKNFHAIKMCKYYVNISQLHIDRKPTFFVKGSCFQIPCTCPGAVRVVYNWEHNIVCIKRKCPHHHNYVIKAGDV